MLNVSIYNGETPVIDALFDRETHVVTPNVSTNMTAWKQLFSISGQCVRVESDEGSWTGIWMERGQNYKLANLRVLA